FDVHRVVFHDILNLENDEYASQVSLKELQNTSDVLSLHTPQTESTIGMIDQKFINQMKKNFWLINTARGSAVITKDLVNGLKSRKILGAGLDVLEYESSSFENIFQTQKNNTDFSYLLNSENVILSPHVGGWTMESYEKLAKIISEKIITTYKK
ncbi:NAD(P)-dependent oxidoreductase, partial [Flavobacteriaceae bacterium]|nr:NAD(P)-dependent oxidoreductase [Flavobacteriaceae bacterium]